ncbi:MAG: multidrug transporter [Deltaproteobacteria bacterium]|nr:multidrug transporter [Deltaproteobacteria bacterium]
MSEEKKEKIVIIGTHGGDDPERASLPFVVGNAALAMDVDVVVALQGNGVTLAKKGCYEHIFAGGLDPLKKLADTFLELGGKIWVCTPCIKERQITKEMLVDNVELMAGGKLVQACIEADAVLNY